MNELFSENQVVVYIKFDCFCECELIYILMN